MIEHSTAVVFGMACAIIALVLLLAILVDEMIRLRHALVDEVDFHHDEAMAAAMTAVSEVMIGRYLRGLAERYSSPAEHALINKIKREVWTPEGKVLPVLWLEHYADLLDPPVSDEVAEYNLAGERVL